MKQNSKNEKMRIENDKLLSDIKSKQADEVTELAESIINTVRGPLLVLDKDLRVVKANRSFFNYFRVSPEETIGALIYDLGNRQWDIPKLKELLEKILPEKTTFDNYEVEHDFAGIGNRILLLNARQIERVFGKEKIILLAIEDITKRKHLEESLSETSRMTSEYLDILVNHAHFPIIIWDASFVITRFNNSFEKLSGYNISELMGKKIDFLFPKDKVESTLKLLENSLGEEKFEINEIDILRKDKEIRTVLWNSANVFDKEGKLIITTIAQDITERKLAEEELQKSEERYRSVTQSANDAIITTDSKGIITDWNKGAQKIFGYLETEISGKKLDMIFLKDELSELIKNREHSEQSGEQSIVNKTVEFQGLHKNGKEFPIELSLTEWEIPSGKFFTGIIRDITERKQNEAEILMLAHSLKSINECVSITDLNDKILFVNKAFLDTYGYDEQELIGKQITKVRSKKNTQEHVKEILPATIQGEWRGELLNQRKDGSEFPIYLSTSIIYDKDSKPLGLIGVASDITAQKQMVVELLKLSSAVEQSPASIIITDIKGNIEYANLKVIETTGYQLSELLGKNPRIFGTGEKSAYDYKVLWDTISSGEEWRGEFQNKKKNGELYWESASISAIINNMGEIIHYLAVKEDITEQKKINEELINAKERAEEMNRLKSNFLANMSHELRTPLVGILGFAEIIRQENVSSEIRVMAETIYKSGNRLSETLNLILDLSQFETEKKETKFQKVELVDKTIEVITLFKETARKKGLLLISSFSAESIFINFDERVYYSILTNLINNAIKFTSEGSITTSVSQYDDSVEISVTDTGIGIAENDYQSIFEEFRQVSEGYSRNFEGTGLGLSITKKFVEKYGGTITVESEVGKGSTFKVILPFTNALETLKETTASEILLSTKAPETKLGKPLGLLVDDDPLVFQVMKRYLRDYVELETTIDAEFAAKMLRKKKYDIIFMDINLNRGMDGKKAATMIRKMDGYEITPIIATTAYALAGDKEEFILAGCSHYLSKPFNKTEINDIVTEVLKP